MSLNPVTTWSPTTASTASRGSMLYSWSSMADSAAGRAGTATSAQDPRRARAPREPGGALPISRPRRREHRAAPAEAHHQVGPLAEFGGGDRDRGAVQPADLRLDAQHLDTLALGPAQDRLHRLGG